jgi:ElaB/YqjD/DUF883 family membrane-anchored ribosome-binding protein
MQPCLKKNFQKVQKRWAEPPEVRYVDLQTAPALLARPAKTVIMKRKGNAMTNEANMEKLGSDLKELSRDAEAMLQATAGQTSEKMSALRDRLSTALESAKSTYHRLEEKTVAGAKVADKTIREHPYTSIGVASGVAFGLGLLIGVLAARR